ncbi:MAG: serine protease [Nitrospirota bacterium]
MLVILTIICSFLLPGTARSANFSASSGFTYVDIANSVKELQQRTEGASPAIVSIVAYDMTGTESGRGSGFFIDTEGRIITNAIIFENAYSAEVASETGNYDNVSILNINDKFDLALIQVNANNEHQLDIDYTYNIKVNEKVDIIGKSDKFERTVSEGNISSISITPEDVKLIKFKKRLPISSFKASNDGPLLNSSGKVIGITTESFAAKNIFGTKSIINDNELNNAISAHSIKTFLSSPGIIHDLQPSGSKVWHKWMLKSLKNVFIVSFITFYSIGFTKTIGIIFAVIMSISLVQWIYNKLKKIKNNR